MGFVVVFALPGVFLALWGIVAMRRPREWATRPARLPNIPAAKIEDGQPFPPSTTHHPSSAASRGVNRIMWGIVLAAAGGGFGLFVKELAEFGVMAHGMR